MRRHYQRCNWLSIPTPAFGKFSKYVASNITVNEAMCQVDYVDATHRVMRFFSANSNLQLYFGLRIELLSACKSFGMNTIIPIIDLRYFKGTPQERSLAIAGLDTTLRTTGFFQLRHHGINKSTIEECFYRVSPYLHL